MGYDWDPPRGERLSRGALRQDSTYPRAWVALGDALAAQGRIDEAARACRAAVAADTLDEQVATATTFGLQHVRLTDEALALARRWHESEPRFWDFAEAYLLVGARRCSAQPPVSPVTPLELACAGRMSAARLGVDSIVAQVERGEGYFPADGIAEMFVGLGDHEAALRWLSRAFEERSSMMVFARVDPIWDLLRDDPRFVELLGRIRPADQ